MGATTAPHKVTWDYTEHALHYDKSELLRHQNSAPSDAGSEGGHQNQIAFL